MTHIVTQSGWSYVQRGCCGLGNLMVWKGNDTFESCILMNIYIVYNTYSLQSPKYPRHSMYGIFTYVWSIFMVDVGKYSIH